MLFYYFKLRTFEFVNIYQFNKLKQIKGNVTENIKIIQYFLDWNSH